MTTTLSFGTAGMRGVMGSEAGQMNLQTIRVATQALANHLKQEAGDSVLIGYDSRHHSRRFAEEAAGVLLANEIRVYLFDELRPVPLLSFGCRHLGTSAGIMITASHNPPEYNGYKVYGSHGGQIVSPEDQQIIAEVEKINPDAPIPVASLDSPLLTRVGEEIDEAYFAATDHLRHACERSAELNIVYTPLHGTGITVVPQGLRRWGFSTLSIVEAQATPDGSFPTVQVPNPEEAEALTLGIEEMERVGGDLVLATDPDCDRVGIALPGGTLLNGNEIAVLALDWLTRSEQEEPVGVAKSIVTTELFRRIAEEHGWQCEELLTGFKYFGQLIDRWEAEGPFHFLFGAEESYGYLLGRHARDKDAVIACQLLCELALDAKLSGDTLIDRLHALYRRFGVYRERVVSLALTGEDRKAPLRAHPPEEIGGERVIAVEDFLEPTLLPPSDVLLYWLEGGDKLVVRPSGTEPKIKLYCGARLPCSDPIEEAIDACDERADHLLNALRKEMNL